MIKWAIVLKSTGEFLQDGHNYSDNIFDALIYGTRSSARLDSEHGEKVVKIEVTPAIPEQRKVLNTLNYPYNEGKK